MKSHIAGSASADTTRMCKNWNAIMYNLTKFIKNLTEFVLYSGNGRRRRYVCINWNSFGVHRRR